MAASDDDFDPVKAADAVMMQIIQAQALSMRVLAEMLDGCNLTLADGTPFTLERYAKQLGIAADALGKMEVKLPAGQVARFDTMVMQVIIASMQRPTQANG